MNQFCRVQTRLDKVRKLIKKKVKKKKKKRKTETGKQGDKETRLSRIWGYRRVWNCHLDYASPPTTGGPDMIRSTSHAHRSGRDGHLDKGSRH
jgi:hypothetical protein